jgi:hypothetical protein
MKQIKNFFIYSFILILSSCGTIKEGFENQKKNSSDEFMVEKKSPLIMPPDYTDLPIPNTEENKQVSKEDKIKNLIINNDPKNSNMANSSEVNKSFEKYLLDMIKNN